MFIANDVFPYTYRYRGGALGSISIWKPTACYNSDADNDNRFITYSKAYIA
jgi:hypothetical protein